MRVEKRSNVTVNRIVRLYFFRDAIGIADCHGIMTTIERVFVESINVTRYAIQAHCSSTYKTIEHTLLRKNYVSNGNGGAIPVRDKIDECKAHGSIDRCW